MPIDVDLARQEWVEGYRRLPELTRDPVSSERIHAEIEAVTAELRRRVGATFTLAELAAAYAHSDDWVADAIGERVEHRSWLRTATVAADAAFHLYSRGATDYVP
jgi:hypothetical protein